MTMKITAVLLIAFVAAMAYAQNLTDVEVPAKCLKCICRASSGTAACKPGKGCDGGVCGPFGITEGYWIDGGENTIKGDEPKSPKAYEHCATNIECSRRTVRGYMKRYAKNCNKDTQIDCADFARIHRLGPNACNGTLTDQYANDLKSCLNLQEV